MNIHPAPATPSRTSAGTGAAVGERPPPAVDDMPANAAARIGVSSRIECTDDPDGRGGSDPEGGRVWPRAAGGGALGAMPTGAIAWAAAAEAGGPSLSAAGPLVLGAAGGAVAGALIGAMMARRFAKRSALFDDRRDGRNEEEIHGVRI